MSARRFILGIEISNPSAGAAGVALGAIEGDALRLLGVETLRARAADGHGPARGGHDDDLMPAIKRLFARANAHPRELDRVGVSVGPGGYTGLRVACVVGKMIAEASGCRCAAIPTARLALAGLPEANRSDAPVAIALSSKGASAWVEVFQPAPAVAGDWARRVSGARVRFSGGLRSEADMPAMADMGVCALIADAYLPAPMRGEAERLRMSVVPTRLSAESAVELAWLLAPADLVDPAMLNPLYPREPDAVTLWNARHGAQG